MLAEREVAYAWTRENLIAPEDILTRQEGADAMRLNLLSLPAWLAVAQRAGINYIPARPLASVDAEDYIAAFDHPKGPEAANYDIFHKAVIAGITQGEMVRMEQVAPREIKSLMSQGTDMTNGLFELNDGSGLYLDLHEDRFYATFKDLGADQVRAFARPIITPEFIPGTFQGVQGQWPVEFRVYVEDDRIVGISNYYPQVAMDPEEYRPVMTTVYRLAQDMLDTMQTLHLGVGNHTHCREFGPRSCMVQRPDWQPDIWASQNFTLDFMLREDGLVTFLEGGPAGMSAAHPCCFLQEGRVPEPDFLHGVAYSDHSPVEALTSLDG